MPFCATISPFQIQKQVIHMTRTTQCPDLPEIGKKELFATDFGADRLGRIRADHALWQAISYLGEEGGRIIFPEGDYLLGPIHFENNLEIRLEKGATIHFSRTLEDYLPPVLGVYEGIRCYRPSAMLHAYQKHDIAITGEGVLDGQGDAWWDMVNYRAGTNHMLQSAEAGEEPEKRVYSTWVDGVRPCFLEFVDCERVLIQGVTFKDSPFWTVHPTWCRQVTVDGITINNPMKDRFHHSPNTDGVNLDGCDTCLVQNCEIFCGDDCVCMKSGKNVDGRRAGHTCQNVEVKNCRFLMGIGGITIGSEMSGGIRNLYCHDIEMKDICIGVWLKSTPERGGFIENMNYENITIDNAAVAGFQVTLWYEGQNIDPKFVPPVHDIYAENITMADGKNGILIEGLPGYEPKRIALQNVKMRAENPIKVINAEDVALNQVTLLYNPKYEYRI